MATIAGNTNQLGVVNPATTGLPDRPGTITRGPGSNKPRIHLVSSKGKIPAGVYAEAIALKQKNQAANAARMPVGNDKVEKSDPDIKGAHLTLPQGVKPYPITPKTGLT